MAQFPKGEPQIEALATQIGNGLTTNAAVYPNPPVTPAQLAAKVAAYQAKRSTANQQVGEAQTAVGEKDTALEDLIDDMKDDLRYAERTVKGDDNKLRLLGWGGRSPSTALVRPGQPRAFEVVRQGDTWVFLDWKDPADGGTVASYEIQRRELPNGTWQTVGSSIESEITLTNQERGKQYEYRVLAKNRAGDSDPSNSGQAVL
jgi:hypothetical protein